MKRCAKYTFDLGYDSKYSKWVHQVESIQKNIARIANAVQVTICLLVSTSVY